MRPLRCSPALRMARKRGGAAGCAAPAARAGLGPEGAPRPRAAAIVRHHPRRHALNTTHTCAWLLPADTQPWPRRAAVRRLRRSAGRMRGARAPHTRRSAERPPVGARQAQPAAPPCRRRPCSTALRVDDLQARRRCRCCALCRARPKLGVYFCRKAAMFLKWVLVYFAKQPSPGMWQHALIHRRLCAHGLRAPPVTVSADSTVVWVHRLQRRSHRGYTGRARSYRSHRSHRSHRITLQTQAAHGLHSLATTCCTTRTFTRLECRALHGWRGAVDCAWAAVWLRATLHPAAPAQPLREPRQRGAAATILLLKCFTTLRKAAAHACWDAPPQPRPPPPPPPPPPPLLAQPVPQAARQTARAPRPGPAHPRSL